MYEVPELTQGRFENIMDCDYDRPPMDGRVCNVDVRKGFGPCTKENVYGYLKHAPCVFLRLDAPRNWTPEFYNESNDLPEDMAHNVKDYIHQIKGNEVCIINVLSERNIKSNLFDLSGILYGCLVMVRVQLTLRILDQLNIIHDQVFLDFFIHGQKLKAI